MQNDIQTTYTEKPIKVFAEEMLSEEKSLYNDGILPGLSIKDAHKLSRNYFSKLDPAECKSGIVIKSNVLSESLNMDYLKVETAMGYLVKEGLLKHNHQEGSYRLTRNGSKFIKFIVDYKQISDEQKRIESYNNNEGFNINAEIPGFDKNLQPIDSE